MYNVTLPPCGSTRTYQTPAIRLLPEVIYSVNSLANCWNYLVTCLFGYAADQSQKVEKQGMSRLGSCRSGYY